MAAEPRSNACSAVLCMVNGHLTSETGDIDGPVLSSGSPPAAGVPHGYADGYLLWLTCLRPPAKRKKKRKKRPPAHLLRCRPSGNLTAGASGPVVAAAPLGADCVYPALYAVFTLPNICTDQAFQAVQAKFVSGLATASGPGEVPAARSGCSWTSGCTPDSRVRQAQVAQAWNT